MTSSPYTRLLSCMLAIFMFIACKSNNQVPESPAPEPTLKTTVLVTNHEIIWGMDFLPNGDLLFTEKRGKIFRYTSAGKTEEISGLPNNILTNGQGGLLDIKVHPAYSSNGWIYISYAAQANGGATLNLSRFKLTGNSINNLQTIFTTRSLNSWFGHYGSRIVFDNKGFLYLSVGEGGTTSYGGANSPNKNAQDTHSDWGKIHRMTDDGKIPADNPVLPGQTTASTIYSYGHRNPQGLAFDPVSNRLWENEHGPMGGDEINLIGKAHNYGWPLVCYGKNYDGVAVSASPTGPGITDPAHYWDPSIAPCGLAVVNSNRFKAWKGNLLTGSLKFNYVQRSILQGDKVVKNEKILENIGRVRNIKEGPDGYLYVSVEGPGRIIRVSNE